MSLATLPQVSRPLRDETSLFQQLPEGIPCCCCPVLNVPLIKLLAVLQWQQSMQMTKLSKSPLSVKPPSFQKYQESVNNNVLQCIPNSMSDMLEQTMLQTHHRELCCTLTLDTAIQQTHRNVHAPQQRLWRANYIPVCITPAVQILVIVTFNVNAEVLHLKYMNKKSLIIFETS